MKKLSILTLISVLSLFSLSISAQNKLSPALPLSYTYNTSVTFDLYNAVAIKIRQDDWLTPVLEDLGITKDEFNSIYSINLETSDTPFAFKKASYNDYNYYQKDAIDGVVRYVNSDVSGEYLEWTLMPADLDKHSNTNFTVQYSSDSTGYRDFYLTVNLDIWRTIYGACTLETKNANYWYDAETGADNGTSATIFDPNCPLNGSSITNWSRNILDYFIGNRINTTYTKKFFFAPIERKIACPDPFTGDTTIYYITPQSSSTDTYYKTMYTYFDVSPSFKWTSEIAANSYISQRCISSMTGVYNNYLLYATTDHSNFKKIATLNPTSGEIILDKNSATEDLVNAVPYAENHSNISQCFGAYVGVVFSKNEIVLPSSDAIFLTAWSRPINIGNQTIDIPCNGEDSVAIYLADIIKLYDWRGNISGNMDEESSKWLWAYYNVNSISVDCSEGTVTPDGSNSSTGNNITVNFNLLNYNGTNYDDNSKSADLYNLFSTDRESFGKIFIHPDYGKGGEYTLELPVSIGYEWGYVKDKLKLNIITPERCSAPEISYKDGKISFSSDTPNASFTYEINQSKHAKGVISEGEVSFTPSYEFTVTCKATADGYMDSETVTKVIEINKADINADGTVDISDVNKVISVICGRE